MKGIPLEREGLFDEIVVAAYNKYSQRDIYSGACFVPEKAWHKTTTYINAPAVGVMYLVRAGGDTAHI